MRVHDGLHALGDAQVAALFRQKRCHGHLVGSVHDARQGSAHAARMTGKLQAAERVGVGRSELQASQLGEIQRLDGRLPTLRVAKRELDGDTHIGGAQVSLHAAISELHHGMDGALRLDHHADLVVGHVEQMMRLDDLQALVHKRGGVDGDLRPHVPSRMVQRLSRRDALKIGTLPAAERAAGGRHPQTGDLSLGLAEQALVNGTVLGIDGHERTRRAHRRRRAGRATPLIHLRRQRHDQIAAHHQALLVRQRKDLARAQRFIACAQAGGAHQRVDDHIRLGQARQIDHGIHAEAPYTLGTGLFAHLGRDGLVGEALIAHGEVAHVMGARLFEHVAYARVHRQADDLKLVGMLPNHVDRLRSDGARGPENNDAFHETLRIICENNSSQRR